MPPKRLPSPSPSVSESGSSGTSSSSEEEEEEEEQELQQQQKTPASVPSRKPLPQKPSAAPSSTAAAVKPTPNPPPTLPNSNDPGSEDEEDDEDEDEEASDDSASPHMAPAAAKPKMPKPKEVAAPAAKPPPSESESESSDSDAKPPPPRRPSRAPDPSIKPISSKPMDGTPKSKKATADKPKPPQASDGVEKRKRKEPEAVEEEETAANGPSGKKLFQRVWTQEDEIALLKGMIEFQEKHGGADLASVIDDFHKFIHKSLHLEFSKIQLSDKMRRLKRKYETNVRRGKRGADPSFAKPHEQASFELSKKIWAGKHSTTLATKMEDGEDMEVENTEEEGEKKGRRKNRSVTTSPRKGRGGSAVSRGPSLVDGEDGEVRTSFSYPKLRDAVALLERESGETSSAGSLWKALESLKPAKAKALEDRWNKHFMTGMKYTLERSELKTDLLKTLVETLDDA